MFHWDDNINFDLCHVIVYCRGLFLLSLDFIIKKLIFTLHIMRAKNLLVLEITDNI